MISIFVHLKYESDLLADYKCSIQKKIEKRIRDDKERDDMRTRKDISKRQVSVNNERIKIFKDEFLKSELK